MLQAPKTQRGVVLRQRDVLDLNILVAPLVEELDRSDLVGNLLRKHREGGGGDLNISVVRHIFCFWGSCVC